MDGKRMLRMAKSKTKTQEYRRSCPADSSPGKFYCKARFHKMSQNRCINALTTRPIASDFSI